MKRMKSKTADEPSASAINEEIEEAKATRDASQARSDITQVAGIEHDGATNRLSSWEILALIARTGMYLDLF